MQFLWGVRGLIFYSTDPFPQMQGHKSILLARGEMIKNGLTEIDRYEQTK